MSRLTLDYYVLRSRWLVVFRNCVHAKSHLPLCSKRKFDVKMTSISTFKTEICIDFTDFKGINCQKIQYVIKCIQHRYIYVEYKAEFSL